MSRKALGFIEDIRNNLKQLHDFFQDKDTIQAIDSNADYLTNSNQMTIKNVTVYSLLQNKSLDVRKLSRFYSLYNWLVSIYEVFVYPNFTSTVGSYMDYPFSSNSTSPLTPFDQTLFLVLSNAQLDMKT